MQVQIDEVREATGIGDEAVVDEALREEQPWPHDDSGRRRADRQSLRGEEPNAESPQPKGEARSAEPEVADARRAGEPKTVAARAGLRHSRLKQQERDHGHDGDPLFRHRAHRCFSRARGEHHCGRAPASAAAR
jgi:hypothetical protein